MRRGSLEFWPHRRAKRQLPRIRHWPKVDETRFLGLLAIKAGMNHIMLIDDSNSPSKGTEVFKPVTILEYPKTYVYGIRLYKKDYTYKEPKIEIYSNELIQKLKLKLKNKHNLEEIKKNMKDFIDARALLISDLSSTGSHNKKLYRYEVAVGGKDISEKIAFIEKWLGKEIKISDIIEEGIYLDAFSISKGKGWQGPIKRYGVAKQPRKATNKVRHVGTLGPITPHDVLYTVPQAGHMGYNYRADLNKRVLMIGNDPNKINVKGGFTNYGKIKNEFIVLEGSIPGAPKRIVRLRYALRANKKAINKPKITYIAKV